MWRVLRCNRGASAVEFALSVMVFITVLLAVIEFSRLMLLWGTASEATRIAARMASTCSMGAVTEAHIQNRVTSLIETSGQINLSGRSGWLTLTYGPSGCTEASCTMVSARLSGLSVRLDIPGVNWSATLPDFVATTAREAMNSVSGNIFKDACS